MRKTLSLLSLAAVILLAAACTERPKTAAQLVPTPEAEEQMPEAETDTLIGWVGDGTSMHNLEFLPLEGDTMELELTDDVERRAELEVGRKIAIVIRWDASMEMQVVATIDPSEVHDLPYPDMED